MHVTLVPGVSDAAHTMSMVRSISTWLLIAICTLPISSYVVFRISLYAIAEFAEGWHSAWFEDSANADIIVLVPDNSPDGFFADLIPLSSAASYRSAHPGSTFFITLDRENLVQERLKTNLKLSWTTFEIKALSDSQEEITLYFMDRTDDSHGSRYRATKDSVQLESYRYVSDRGGIGIVLLAMVVTAALDILVVASFIVHAIHIRRKRLRSQDATH